MYRSSCVSGISGGKAERKIKLMSVIFDDISDRDAALKITAEAEKGHSGYVVTPNAVICRRAFSDPLFAQLINGATVVLPDGKGVRLGAMLSGDRFLSDSASGVHTGWLAAEYSALNKIPVFFLGGKAGVAKKAAEKLSRAFPGLRVSGYCDGFSLDEEAMAALVKKSGARLVYVCLGSPRQEYFCKKLSDECGTVCLALGGSLDIYSGCKKRAPSVLVSCGLEWLFRIACEPHRISAVPEIISFLSACAFSRRKTQGKHRAKTADF